ncbi:Exosome complex component rrp42 [Xanthoria calcicola]
MPPSTLLSPSELSYLHSSLSLDPPIRPDARSPTTFRPLVAETDLLPTTNGSARLCFADGSEAIVGVKAEVERTIGASSTSSDVFARGEDGNEDTKMHSAEEEMNEERRRLARGKGQDSWIDVTIDMPGFARDDDGVVVFLAQMLQEGLVADGGLRDRLWIGWGWHWRIYVDILLLTTPNSYPLPLLSLTTHLALLATRLPAPISRIDEDPLFNDDWDAAEPLYPPSGSAHASKPPFTLLVISVEDNIFFDPSREELAVADAVCAVTVGTIDAPVSSGKRRQGTPKLRLLSLRTIDPPARLAAAASSIEAEDDQGAWRPARGGMKRAVVGKMVKVVLEVGGVGEEVMTGLEGFHNG